jgi:hypothetical protein
MSGQLGDLVVSFSADMAKFTSDMGKAVKVTQHSSSRMVGSLELVTGAISKMGTALIGMASIAGFAKLINSAADWNIQAQKMANTFGITTEASSVFEVAIAKLGISHDTAVNAALKLSRTLSQGTDKFDQYGISVLDANGKLLPMPQIMANVNEALMMTKSGADRNVMAMTLYGRSWGELQEILRLTPEAMNAAQATAERLHLIVGPEGVAKAYAYKESIHEVELVSRSLALQFGNELMPAITSVMAAMSNTNFAGTFGAALKGIIRDIQEAVVYWTAGADKLAVFMKNGGPLGLIFNKTAMMSQMAIIQDAEAKSLRDIATSYATPTKTSETPTGGTITPKSKSKSTAGADNSARNAYLAYLKTYYETIAQLQIQANAAEEQANQISWNWGLTDLKTYLDKKHTLNENSLQIELDAKKKELTAAQIVEVAAEAAYNKDPSGNAAAAVNKSYATTQKAIEAVNAAQAKLTEKKVADADETKKDLFDESKALNSLQVQVLELTGQYEKGAKAKLDFYRASPEYQRLSLSPEGLEQKKLIDIQGDYSVSQGKQKDVSVTQNMQFANRAIGNKIPDIFGNTAGPQAALKLQYDQATATINDEIKKMDDLYQKDTENYKLAIEKKKLIDEEYAANKKNLDFQTWENSASVVSGQLGKLAGMMDKNNREQFLAWKALAVAQATVSAALAIAGFLGANSKLGAMAIPLSIAEGAIAAMQIGIIASTQYQGKALGGSVDMGQSYIVGEKGPELFTPGASGMITPNNKLGGAIHIVNNNDFRNASPETEQRMRAEIKRSAEQTKAAIYNSMQRGGSFAHASGRMQ